MEYEMGGTSSTHAEWEVDVMWLRNVATGCLLDKEECIV
jgi:hypothetical protein